MKINVSGVLHTNGKGYWSDAKKAVYVKAISLAYVDDEGTFGELRVYFDTTSWDVDTDGLIYTDSLFLSELRALLSSKGLVGKVTYSEQGMQGDDYVSLDVGKEFIDSINSRLSLTI